MKYRININWTPENEYVEEWHTMTKAEFLGGWQLLNEDWDEMEAAGAIIPLENVIGMARRCQRSI
jgi:hypothetical protein